jgi:putative transposase
MHAHLAHVRPIARQPIVFITVVTHGRRAVLAQTEPHSVLTEQWTKSQNELGWAVGRYVVMPDHVHLFARPALDSVALAEWVRRWKGAGAREICRELQISAPLWQQDYFDRYLRNGESYSEKWNYVANNPVRRNLVSRAEEWPWQGTIVDLSF